MEEKIMDLLVQLAEGQKQLFEGQKRLETHVEQLELHVGQLTEEQKRTNVRLDALENRMTDVETQMAKVENRMAGVEDRMTEVEQRMTGVEDRMSEVEQRMTKTEIILENRVVPQLHLLAEGHTGLTEHLTRMDAAYARQEDVEVLQLAVQRHTKEIREIRAAM